MNSLRDLTGRLVNDGSLHLEKLVGAGAFGNLYRACDSDSTRSRPSSWASSSSSSSTPSSHSSTPSSASSTSSKVYAVKCLEKHVFDSPEANLIERERCLHSQVSSHPNIVTFHRHFVDKEHEYFVMDFHDKGDMFRAITDHVYYRNTPLIKRTFAGVVDAIRFCHRQGVYHRDIKPENILVDAFGGNPCLTDFGLATTSCVSHSVSGTPPYMSPGADPVTSSPLFTDTFSESFQSEYSPAQSDAWALSILLMNLVTERWAWTSASPERQGSFKKRYLPDPEKFLRATLPISRPFASLLVRSLHPDPGSRISLEKFAEAVQLIEDLFISHDDLATASPAVRRAAKRPSGVKYVQPAFEAPAPTGTPHETNHECPPGLTPAPPPRASATAHSMPGDPSPPSPLRLQPEAGRPHHKPGKVKRFLRRLRFWRK
ncbi:kinase-like domain-containing protein [Roridomyces roridus]|uniref:non-specific serine/threonine protein kinase n=1 Tax=Roridomyces roridus TaxID=1738132 RepID=A0AAD7G371_9AGAR|nr:kinase-like domain-containing protein [Roridomyces roridus]